MPISEYFGGSGEKVMDNMQDEYGGEEGKRVFYATANKRGEAPKGGKKKGKKGSKRRHRKGRK